MRIRDLVGAVLLCAFAVLTGSTLRNFLDQYDTSASPAVSAEVGRHKHDHDPAYTADLVIMEPSECQATALANIVPLLSGAESVTWVWADLPKTPRGTNAAGYAYAKDNAVSLSVPHLDCAWVPAVVVHEWMHLATWETYGGYPEGMENGETLTELIADCGSKVLGERFGYPTYTNYADRAGGCSPTVLAHVEHILQTV